MTEVEQYPDEQFVGVAEIAELAGVTKAAVANWRARGTRAFPAPVHEGKNGPLYRLTDVAEWLRRRPGQDDGDAKPLLGVEAALWGASDKLRGSVDPSQYRHLVLTLLFLRRVLSQSGAPAGLVVPEGITWDDCIVGARADQLPTAIRDVIQGLEASNERLRGVLPDLFVRTPIDPRRLHGLVGIITDIARDEAGARDQLGRVYEYFLGRFASLEGRSGGEFYTPHAIVRLLAEIVEPVQGTLYDPCCGSGGMFVQSARVRDAHGGRKGRLNIRGQELNEATWRLAQMNLALHNLEGDLGDHPADTFHENLHEGLLADYVLANPPFNISDWGVGDLVDDPRWQYGTPPAGNANLAWVQHIWAHMSPRGRAGIVLSNGSLTSDSPTELAIRSRLISADAVECMIALPPQLFYSTTIPVTLWFLAKNKAVGNRRKKVLFIDARSMGEKVTRSHRDLRGAEMVRIVEKYRAWRDGESDVDETGFSAIVTIDRIEATGWSLAPSRYVEDAGAEHAPESLEELVAEYRALHAEAALLDSEILAALHQVMA